MRRLICGERCKSQIPTFALTLAILGVAVVATSILKPRQVEVYRHLKNDIPHEKATAGVTIGSVQEFAAAMEAELLVLHIDVDWSMTAAQSRLNIAELKSSLQRDSTCRGVLFRRVDCTEQAGPIWDALRQWLMKSDLKASRLNGALYGGAGSLIWARAGRIVGFVNNAASESNESLLARTRAAISPK